MIVSEKKGREQTFFKTYYEEKLGRYESRTNEYIKE